MPLHDIVGSISSATTVKPSYGPAQKSSVAKAAPVDFAHELKAALTKVSDLQGQEDALKTEVLMGSPTVSLEQTMVAAQKADIAFKATTTVRNRMVQAYSDVMNMQI